MAGGPHPFSNAFKSLPAGSFRYNTSQAGSAVPIVYGTQRLPPNLLEFWGFSGGSGKGGKGGGGKSGGKKGATANYSVYVAMALCQGPVADTGAAHGSGGYNRVWANGGVSFANQVGLNFFAGNDGQSADPVFVSKDPYTPVLGYSGLAYVTGDPLQLGQSPALPNFSYEIRGVMAGTAGPNFPDDARPDQIVADMLTNARYGSGFPAANLDTAGSLADFGTYCQAAQLAMSLLMDRPQPAGRWLDEIAQLAVSAVVWSGGLLKIIPYATGGFAGNGATWSPNLTPQYALTDDDFIPWTGGAGGVSGGTDPVVVTRNDPSSLSNWLGLEYFDSINNYNPNIVPVWDQGAIDLYGVKTEPSVVAHEFTNVTSAAVSAQLQLNRKQSVRNTFKFQLGWRYALLDPMDIVTVTDPGAGLNAVPVRITAISETANGELQIDAEELPGVSSGAPPVYPQFARAGNPLDLFASPGNANPPIVFEPPPGLTSGNTEVWLLSSGGANWGGANVWVSTDGSSYALAGTIYAGARQGTSTATLPAYGGNNPDTSNTLAVDLTQSLGQLVSGSAGDAANAVTLCYCGGELLSYQTATLTATSRYSLTTLYRGAYGTAAAAHPSGSAFAYLGLQAESPGLFKYAYPSNLVGQTISVKLQSFNKFGGALQDLSGVSPTSYLLTGAGINPIDNPIITALAGGSSQDWGIVGTSVIGAADFAPVAIATGLTINLGTLA